MWGPALVPVSNPYTKVCKMHFSNKVRDIPLLLFHYKFTTDIAKDIAELTHPLEAMKVVNVHTGLNSQK